MYEWKIFFQAIYPKSLIPRHSTLVMSWLDSSQGASTIDDMERVQPTKGQGLTWPPCVTRGTGADTQLPLFHNSSNLTREMKQQSLSRAFHRGTPWVKMSTICRLHLTLDLSRLLLNTYTVKGAVIGFCGKIVGIWIHRPNKYTPSFSAPSEAHPTKFMDAQLG